MRILATVRNVSPHKPLSKISIVEISQAKKQAIQEEKRKAKEKLAKKRREKKKKTEKGILDHLGKGLKYALSSTHEKKRKSYG